MRIEVLGDGCVKCKTLLANTLEAVQGLDSEVEVESVNDPQRIAYFGLLSLPGLAIDGELKVSGKTISAEDIRKLL